MCVSRHRLFTKAELVTPVSLSILHVWLSELVGVDALYMNVCHDAGLTGITHYQEMSTSGRQEKVVLHECVYVCVCLTLPPTLDIIHTMCVPLKLVYTARGTQCVLMLAFVDKV